MLNKRTRKRIVTELAKLAMTIPKSQWEERLDYRTTTSIRGRVGNIVVNFFATEFPKGVKGWLRRL